MTAKYSDSTEAIDVRYVAHLARLYLSDEEVEKFQSQLDDILKYFHKLDELDTEDVEPMAHVAPLKNIFRKDQIQKSLGHHSILQNAPKHFQGQMVVPKILE